MPVQHAALFPKKSSTSTPPHPVHRGVLRSFLGQSACPRCSLLAPRPILAQNKDEVCSSNAVPNLNAAGRWLLVAGVFYGARPRRSIRSCCPSGPGRLKRSFDSASLLSEAFGMLSEKWFLSASFLAVVSTRRTSRPRHPTQRTISRPAPKQSPQIPKRRSPGRCHHSSR